MKKNVVILAAGPPKKDRNRHLEKIGSDMIIDNVIDACSLDNINLFVVISKTNLELIEYIGKFYKNVKVLTTPDYKVRSTFFTALKPYGDCILVVGDLTRLRKEDIEKFVFSKYSSATCHYKIPWGNHIFSKDKSILRRSDTGDCISLIAQDHKEEFLSKKNYERAKYLFYKFYPHGNQHSGMNEYWYNDTGTFMSFAFFEKIWSNPNCFFENDKGTITFQHKVYEDND